MKKLLVLLACICQSCFCLAQNTMEGSVVDAQDGEAVPMAQVILLSREDSLRVFSTICDFEGHYSFSYLPQGRYTFSIEARGYETLKDSLVLTADNSKISRVDKLSLAAQMLEGVTVTAGRTRQDVDKKVVTFSGPELSAAYNSMDLVKTLPGIKANVQTGGVSSVDGGEVLILVNGIKATDNEVKNIPKHKIKNVEIYDIPPARYQDVARVINIKTSPLDDGFIVDMEGNTAVSTGFSNDNAYFAWNKGKNKFTAAYQLYVRNYKDREYSHDYTYNLGGEDYRLYQYEKSHFGYTDHNPSLKYSYVDFDKTVVEVTAKPNYNHYFNGAAGDGTYVAGAEGSRPLDISSSSVENTFAPVIDAYYWQRLSKNDELSLNAVGTLYDVKQTGLDSEAFSDDGTSVYYDDRDLHNDKYSIIGEVAYTHQFASWARWNTGYRTQAAFLHSKADNEFGHFDYHSRFLNHSAYTELSGGWKGTLYRVSLGLAQTYNKSDGVKVKNLSFTPRVVLGYNFGHGHSLRAQYYSQPIAPNINDLSSNISNVTINILSVGNPELESALRQNVYLMYNLENKYVELALAAKYAKTKRVIIDYFEEEEGSFWLKRVNGDHYKMYGGEVSLSIMPLGNRTLQLQCWLGPARQSIRSDYLNYSLTSWGNYVGLSYNGKAFSASYEFSIPAYSISGAYCSKSEPASHLDTSYKWKSWEFSASAYWIGKACHYKSKLIPGMAVASTNHTWIYNNQNMVVLGVAWHFMSGKDKQYNRKLNNGDYASPTK